MFRHFFRCCVELNCIVDFNESERNFESQERQRQQKKKKKNSDNYKKKLNILKSNQCFIDQLHDQMNKCIIKYIGSAHISFFSLALALILFFSTRWIVYVSRFACLSLFEEHGSCHLPQKFFRWCCRRRRSVYTQLKNCVVR